MATFPIPPNPDDFLFSLSDLPHRPDLFERAPPDANIRIQMSIQVGSEQYRSAIAYEPGNLTVEDFFGDIDFTLDDFLDQYPEKREEYEQGLLDLDEIVSIKAAWQR